MHFNDIDVLYNGQQLIESVDYYWTSGRLVLRRPKPLLGKRSFAQKLWLGLTFQWRELRRPETPVPEFVVVENWEFCSREMYVRGTSAFENNVAYEEDLK
jgi:hypothetical protein